MSESMATWTDAAEFLFTDEPLDLPDGVGVGLIRNGSFVHGFGAAL